jgi:hypothetical protein
MIYLVAVNIWRKRTIGYTRTKRDDNLGLRADPCAQCEKWTKRGYGHKRVQTLNSETQEQMIDIWSILLGHYLKEYMQRKGIKYIANYSQYLFISPFTFTYSQ